MIKLITSVYCDDCLTELSTKDTAYAKKYIALCQECLDIRLQLSFDKYPLGTIICSLCKGTKEILYHRDESYEQVFSKCYNCKGKGHIIS